MVERATAHNLISTLVKSSQRFGELKFIDSDLLTSTSIFQKCTKLKATKTAQPFNIFRTVHLRPSLKNDVLLHFFSTDTQWFVHCLFEWGIFYFTSPFFTFRTLLLRPFLLPIRLPGYVNIIFGQTLFSVWYFNLFFKNSFDCYVIGKFLTWLELWRSIKSIYDP